MRKREAASSPLFEKGWHQGRSLFLFVLLLVLGLLSFRFPIPYYFGEGVTITSLFFFISLILFGPLPATLSFVSLAAGYYLLMDPDTAFLILATRLMLSAISYVLMKRNLLVSELVVWILAGLPALWIASATGVLYAAERLTLSFAIEMSVSVLCAVLAEILNAYGVLPKLIRTERRSYVRVPVRRMLLHVTYAPLMGAMFFYLVFSGQSGERRIIATAQDILSNAEQSMLATVESWSQKERQELALGSTLQRVRLQHAFVSLESHMPGTMVLFDTNGKVVQTTYARGEDTTFDLSTMWSLTLPSGMQLLSETGPTGGMTRFWQTAVFSRTLSLHGQRTAFLLPIHSVDSFLDQQVQLILTAGPFLLVGLLLLIVVSRKIEVSLNHLADGTTELLQHLSDGRQHNIPKSGILEVDALADNFLFMNKTLDDLFGELQAVNDDLVSQSDQLRRSEAELFRLAHFDVLTQLPNRYYLRIQMRRILEQVGETDGNLALLLVDLDKFKPINDVYGHSVGDLVLQEVGNQFRRIVGDKVENGDFSARLGGDEFVAIVLNKPNAEVRTIAEKLVKALSTPFSVAEIEARIACSVGISYWPTDGKELGTLLRRADLAMYTAKQQGGNCWAEFGQETGENDFTAMAEDAAMQLVAEDAAADEVSTLGEPSTGNAQNADDRNAGGEG